MPEHILKIVPPYFDSVASGRKTMELRKDDRGYAVGDTLILREWDPDARVRVPATSLNVLEMDNAAIDAQRYTGREVRVTVTDITRGESWLQPGVVALSIRGPRAEALERLYEAIAELGRMEGMDR